MARFFKLTDKGSTWIDLDHVCLLSAVEESNCFRLYVVTHSGHIVEPVDRWRWYYLKEHFFVDEGIGIGE